MEIKLYFCDFDNVGDALNRYIYKKCFDIDVAYADSWRADYAGIGSILDHLLFQYLVFIQDSSENPGISRVLRMPFCMLMMVR